MRLAVPVGIRKLVPLPRTLRVRLFLILLAGLTAAHVLSFAVLFQERTMSAKATMYTTLENDVGTAITLLDRLGPQERPQWLTLLDRRTYRYRLDRGVPGVPELSARAAEIRDVINVAAGKRFAVTVESIPGEREHLQAHVVLSDGSPVTIDVVPALMPLAAWLPWLLAAQLGVLVLCTWMAVRLAITPLLRLATAAETLDPSRNTARLEEAGPAEVAHAATAFNAMRDRIAHYLQERVQILAAISHDLQTPLTRMKLRAEMAVDGPEKDRLVNDLSEIERLVREGVAYAKSAHGDAEKPVRVDIGSFVHSLAFDYRDTGKAVAVPGAIAAVAVTRPHALRRILTNLIDNALKFAGNAEIHVGRTPEERLVIAVLDRGPGIPAGELDAVMQPFYRLEASRSRDTGGTGLGLAIAQQLAIAIGATVRLTNRPGGGLAAEVTLG